MQELFLNNKAIDVTIIGRVTLDLNPTDYYNTLDKNKNFNLYVGGSAGNIALGLHRLGRKINFISRIGSDNLSKKILNFLEEEKFLTSEIQIDADRKTGLTFTEMISDHESNIIMYRENVADLFIDDEKITLTKISDSKMVLVSAVSLAGDISSRACNKVVSVAKKSNSTIVFDLDYRPYTWISASQTSSKYWNIAKQANIIIGSEEEFGFLTTSLNKEQNLEGIFQDLFTNYNAKIIVLKQGGFGAIAYTKTKKYKIGVVQVKMLKGFGGGDAFCAAFIDNLLQYASVPAALQKATAAAAMVVASASSSEPLPSKDQLQDFFEQHVGELNYEVHIW